MSGCCRIDPIHHGGIYIPLLVPVFRCLLLPLSSFLSLRRPSRAHQPHHRRGGFSRATAYAATFLEALAQAPSLSPSCHHPALQLPGPPRYSLFSSCCSKMQRPLSTRQIFSPHGATTFHPRSQRGAVVYTDFWNFRSCDRELLRRWCAREDCCVRWARENSDRGRFARACELRLPHEVFEFIRTRGFPRCFISRYLRDEKIACSLYCCHYVALNTLNTVVVFN